MEQGADSDVDDEEDPVLRFVQRFLEREPVGVLQLFRRLAAPEGTDPRAVSPLYADDLSGLAPALVVVPTLDPVADHGRAYAERLRAAGTPARLTEHPGATHAFLSMPGAVPQAKAARAEITEFLRSHLTG
jgi:acetyl esterase